MSTANVDPITLEIIRNRLEFMANAMQRTLLRSAVSVILKEGEDGSCGIMWPNGDTVAQASGCPIHLTVMPDAVRAVTAWFALDEMREGDAYILNDPYNGGTHLPDILMVMPILYAGQVVVSSMGRSQVFDGVASIFANGLGGDDMIVIDSGVTLPVDGGLLAATPLSMREHLP